MPEEPSDEFGDESREIVGKISLSNSIEESAEIISKVFSRAFSENFRAKDCMETAEKTYKALKET